MTKTLLFSAPVVEDPLENLRKMLNMPEEKKEKRRRQGGRSNSNPFRLHHPQNIKFNTEMDEKKEKKEKKLHSLAVSSIFTKMTSVCAPESLISWQRENNIESNHGSEEECIKLGGIVFERFPIKIKHSS